MLAESKTDLVQEARGASQDPSPPRIRVAPPLRAGVQLSGCESSSSKKDWQSESERSAKPREKNGRLPERQKRGRLLERLKKGEPSESQNGNGSNDQ